MISKLGSGALQTKMDIKSAFLFVPIYQSDFDLLGFFLINGLYHMDKCLPIFTLVNPVQVWFEYTRSLPG